VQTFALVGSPTESPALLDRGLEQLVSDREAKPLRLGMIGLGAVAQAVHLPLLAKRPDLFRPTAVCDLSPSTRARVGDALGVPSERWFATADELLAAGDLDAVAVLTSGSHGALAAAAARAGLAVFCEKPLAYTLAEADALAELDPRLLLGYMKLYDPAVERARALLADRPQARSVEVTVLHPPSAPQLAHAGLLPPAEDVDPTRLERLAADEAAAVERALGPVPRELAALYGDVLLGSVVHDLAVVRSLVGGPLAFDHGDAWPDEAPTSIALSGQLSGGTRVSIRWHYLERYPAYREEVRVHDDQGTVALTFPSPYLLHAPTVLTVVDGDEGAERVSETRSTVEAFERQWLAFAALALDGAAPRAGVAEGRADIVACQSAAAALAARQGISIGGEAA
jgi:myo-inositol 2-dehydrogenase / D-chiro-inositol 1-dehydrogenase